MTDDKKADADSTDAEKVPSGASTDGTDASDNADDASGGAPDDPTTEADGTPVENPAG